MNIKFEVKMTDKAMYNFMLYHTYTHFNGIIGAVFGIAMLALGIRAIVQGDINSSMIFFLFAVLFLGFTPAMLKTRAKVQVSKTPMFQKPIGYELTEEGICVSQDGEEAFTKWNDLMKAVETRKSVILYVTRMRALIFPKECLGSQYADTVDMIRAHMPRVKVKLRRVSR